MSLFQLYEKRKNLYKKIQPGSIWRWKRFYTAGTTKVKIISRSISADLIRYCYIRTCDITESSISVIDWMSVDTFLEIFYLVEE